MHERPEYNKPITELQFAEQQEVMRWMAERILESVDYVEPGGDLDDLLDNVAADLQIRRDDLYYGIQYAKETNRLRVKGRRVYKSD